MHSHVDRGQQQFTETTNGHNPRRAKKVSDLLGFSSEKIPTNLQKKKQYSGTISIMHWNYIFVYAFFWTMSKNTVIPISIAKSLCLIISHTFLRYTQCLPVAILSSDLSPSNHLGQRHVCVLQNRICLMHIPPHKTYAPIVTTLHIVCLWLIIFYMLFICYVRSFLYFDGRHEITSIKPNSALNSNLRTPNSKKTQCLCFHLVPKFRNQR